MEAEYLHFHTTADLRRTVSPHSQTVIYQSTDDSSESRKLLAQIFYFRPQSQHFTAADMIAFWVFG